MNMYLEITFISFSYFESLLVRSTFLFDCRGFQILRFILLNISWNKFLDIKYSKIPVFCYDVVLEIISIFPIRISSNFSEQVVICQNQLSLVRTSCHLSELVVNLEPYVLWQVALLFKLHTTWSQQVSNKGIWHARQRMSLMFSSKLDKNL